MDPRGHKRALAGDNDDRFGDAAMPQVKPFGAEWIGELPGEDQRSTIFANDDQLASQ